MARRRRGLAAVVVAGVVASIAAVLPVGTAPGRAAPVPDPDPTVSGSPSEPPAPAVAVTAEDIPVGAGYWQGLTETYPLKARVRNTGTPPVTAETRFTLPPGVELARSEGGPGCTADSLVVTCRIAPRSAATITLDVTVAPGLWRDPPTGTVQVSATAGGRTATDRARFGIDFPPGPPTPGIDLGVSDPFLPADPADPEASTEPTTLEVRLSNTGSVRADGTVDVVTPPGVEVATVPAECVTRVRVSAERERCQVGRVPAGQRLTLRFTLVVDRAARAEAPLLGSVHGSLTPPGQDAAARQASYSVLISARPDERAGPTGGDDPDVTVAQPRRGAGFSGIDPVDAGSRVGQPLSVLPIVVSLIGVFTTVAAMVILPLRRRPEPGVDSAI
ncbi:hypothetical protein GCM10009557_18860 [Virgisporangium ochraceum]